MANGLNQKYRHSGGFDDAMLVVGIRDILAKHSPGSHAMSQDNCLALIKRLSVDARVTDIRYMAYMLATVTKEARELRTFARPASPSSKNKPATPAKPAKPISQWVIYEPVNENWKGQTLNYLEPVKVAPIPEGALITEIDGDQFWVNKSGLKFKDAYAAKSNQKIGAVYGGARSKIYADAPGNEVHFRGRGLVQITWWYNYASVSFKLGRGLDLLFSPDNTMQADTAYEIMVRGMLDGWFKAGETCAKHLTDSTTKYVKARDIINPGDETHRQEIADTAVAFETLLMSARRSVIAAR
jgi:hypothetical protein